MAQIGEKVTLTGVVTEFFANEHDGVVADMEQADGKMVRLRINPENSLLSVYHIWSMLKDKKEVTVKATKFGMHYFDAQITNCLPIS